MSIENEKVTTAVREVRVGRIAGLSSYELAVKHGYKKTEEEFVNEQVRAGIAIQELTQKVNELLQRLPEGISFSVKNGELVVDYDQE